MIGTLLAQEFRATRKALAAAIGLSLVVAAVSLAATAFRIPVLGNLGLVVGVLLVCALIPMTLVILAVNYWRTMYGGEGYFTMVIPVRGRTIYTAKVLYALIATALVAVITLAAGTGAAAAVIRGTGGDVAATFERAWHSVQGFTPVIVVVAVLAVLLQIVYVVVLGATGMSVGASGRFAHLGFAGPVIFWVIAYFVMQVLNLVGIAFVPFGVRISGPDAGEIVAAGMWSDLVVAVQQSASGAAAAEPAAFGLGFLVVTLAVTIVLAWWGARVVDRHTSLR